jgi:hypothetical protein
VEIARLPAFRKFVSCIQICFEPICFSGFIIIDYHILKYDRYFIRLQIPDVQLSECATVPSSVIQGTKKEEN